MIAQLVGFCEWAQVDRHHGADVDAVGWIVAVFHVSAQGASHGRQQHVVDRAAQDLADQFDIAERNRLRPGCALAHAEGAFVDRARIRPDQQEFTESCSRAGALGRQVQGMARIRQGLQTLVQQGVSHLARGGHHAQGAA